MPLKYNGKNISLAKNLRKNATKEENHLWYDFLSKYPIRFQRQKAIDDFIVDFYCSKAKLVIEIDGAQHYTEEGREKDELRKEKLAGYGLKVIRFTNRQINDNFHGVCGYIDKTVNELLTVEWCITPPPSHGSGAPKTPSVEPRAARPRFSTAPSMREPKRGPHLASLLRFRGGAKHARRASDEFFLFRTAKGPTRRETGGRRSLTEGVLLQTHSGS